MSKKLIIGRGTSLENIVKRKYPKIIGDYDDYDSDDNNYYTSITSSYGEYMCMLFERTNESTGRSGDGGKVHNNYSYDTTDRHSTRLAPTNSTEEESMNEKSQRGGRGEDSRTSRFGPFNLNEHSKFLFDRNLTADDSFDKEHNRLLNDDSVTPYTDNSDLDLDEGTSFYQEPIGFPRTVLTTSSLSNGCSTPLIVPINTNNNNNKKHGTFSFNGVIKADTTTMPTFSTFTLNARSPLEKNDKIDLLDSIREKNSSFSLSSFSSTINATAATTPLPPPSPQQSNIIPDDKQQQLLFPCSFEEKTRSPYIMKSKIKQRLADNNVVVEGALKTALRERIQAINVKKANDRFFVSAGGGGRRGEEEEREREEGFISNIDISSDGSHKVCMMSTTNDSLLNENNLHIFDRKNRYVHSSRSRMNSGASYSASALIENCCSCCVTNKIHFDDMGHRLNHIVRRVEYQNKKIDFIFNHIEDLINRVDRPPTAAAAAVTMERDYMVTKYLPAEVKFKRNGYGRNRRDLTVSGCSIATDDINAASAIDGGDNRGGRHHLQHDNNDDDDKCCGIYKLFKSFFCIK